VGGVRDVVKSEVVIKPASNDSQGLGPGTGVTRGGESQRNQACDNETHPVDARVYEAERGVLCQGYSGVSSVSNRGEVSNETNGDAAVGGRSARVCGCNGLR